MIPPFPLQLALLGSALYGELATGLWRALAAPWLEPGWPASACTPDRRMPPPRAPRPAPAAEDGGAGGAPTAGPRAPADAPEGQVIEVPRGRWQRRRAGQGSLPDAG